MFSPPPAQRRQERSRKSCHAFGSTRDRECLLITSTFFSVSLGQGSLRPRERKEGMDLMTGPRDMFMFLVWLFCTDRFCVLCGFGISHWKSMFVIFFDVAM